EQDCPDVLRRRWAWFEAQPDRDPDRLVFIDEAWASTNMARTHGRVPRGERLLAATLADHDLHRRPAQHRHGRAHGAHGPINGSLLQGYVEQVLVLELRPGDIVVMDNLGSHKGAGVRATIEAAGANLLTPCPTAPTSTQSSRLSPS
ncbi:MAG: IS630 family transposase, partial [Cytophagaceae bacterium]